MYTFRNYILQIIFMFYNKILLLKLDQYVFLIMVVYIYKTAQTNIIEHYENQKIKVWLQFT